MNRASAEIDQIGHALDRYAAGTSLNAGVKGLGEELRANFAATWPASAKPSARRLMPAEEKHCRLAASQDRAAAPTIPRGEQQGGAGWALRAQHHCNRSTPYRRARSTWGPDRALCRAAAIAAAPSAAKLYASVAVGTQLETVRPRASISEVSGASYAR